MNESIVKHIKPAVASQYKDLMFYQKAFQVSLEIHQSSVTWPKYEQYGGLADQMRRASKSVCANIAEGFVKQQRSNAEFKRFLLIALGSAEEMKVWLDYAVNLKYIDDDIFKKWANNYTEIIKMMQSFYSKTQLQN
jgi:four helix bundle protein